MWFKKKEKKVKTQKKVKVVGFDNDWNKEIERYEKLLDAYELMARDGRIPQDVLKEANRQKEYAEELSVNSHDYYSAQNALTVLWDAYEILENGKRSAIEQAKASKLIQCSNCQKTYDSSRKSCPVCGIEP
jgi:hypothetical protein